MKNTWVALAWTCLALLAAGRAAADVVADLHAARIPVTEQSSQALAAAARQAMAEVLVKVSGSSDVLQNPAIVSALSDARNHVQQYAYLRGQAPEPPLSIRFDFDGAYINNLVVQAGAPLWTANRPTVLAWVVVEDEQGRHFVDRHSDPVRTHWLLDEFSRRGVPVQLPMFDLVDTAAVSVDDVWRMDAGAIRAASARYRVQDVVAARLTSLGGDSVAGDWTYFRQDEQITRAFTVPDLQAFLRSGVNIVAADMAARYAVVPGGTTGEGILMSVSGVSDYADYAAIVSWLQKLELVAFANLERLQGDRIELRLHSQAEPAQLASIIALNERLQPLATPADGAQLAYLWRK